MSVSVQSYEILAGGLPATETDPEKYRYSYTAKWVIAEVGGVRMFCTQSTEIYLSAELSTPDLEAELLSQAENLVYNLKAGINYQEETI